MFKNLICCLFILISFSAAAAEMQISSAVMPGAMSFTVDTPAGWLRDDKAGIKQGVDAAFYPQNTTWVEAPAVIYARKTPRVAGSVQKTIDADIAVFTEVMPELTVSDEQGLFTADNKLAFVKRLEDAKTGNTEVLAYIGEADSVTIIALDTKTKQAAVKSQPAFKALVNSYRAASTAPAISAAVETPKPKAEVPAIVAEEPKIIAEAKAEAEPVLKTKRENEDEEFFETDEVVAAKDICPPVKLDQKNINIRALEHDFRLNAPKGWAYEVADGVPTFYQPSSSCGRDLGVIRIASRHGMEEGVSSIIASAADHFGYDLSKMKAAPGYGDGLNVKTRDNKFAVIQRYQDKRSGQEIALAYVRTPNPVPKNDTYTVMLLSSGSKQNFSSLTPDLETLAASYRQRYKTQAKAQ